MPSYNNYGNYPYGNPYQPFNANNNYNNQQPQPMQPQPAQQTIPFMPLTFTSGLVGAKAYIVAPNQTVFLKDSDVNSNLLFEKSADNYGRYTLKAYELTEINIDEIGKEKISKPNIEYTTKEEFEAFKKQINAILNSNPKVEESK